MLVWSYYRRYQKSVYYYCLLPKCMSKITFLIMLVKSSRLYKCCYSLFLYIGNMRMIYAYGKNILVPFRPGVFATL